MSYNYNTISGRLVAIPGLTVSIPLTPGLPYTSAVVDTNGFTTIVVRLSTTATVSYDVTFRYTGATTETIDVSAGTITDKVASIENKVLSRAVSIIITPPAVGPPFTLNMSCFWGSSVSSSSASGGGDLVTINAPITDTNNMELTRGVIAAQDIFDVPRNIKSYRAGELQVGRYDGSLRQQYTDSTEILNISRDSGWGLKSGSGVVQYNGTGSRINSNSGNTYVESANCAYISGNDDTIIMRFSCRFINGNSRLIFGDAYFGVGVNSGSFGITYASGAIPTIYQLVAGIQNEASGNFSMNLDGTNLPTTVTSFRLVPAAIAEANRAAGSPLSVAMRKSRAYFRRLGPPIVNTTQTVTNSCFYDTPTVYLSNTATQVWINSSSFNIDKMDGTGTLPAFSLPSTVRGELVFTPIGEMILMIANPDGVLVPVHRASLGIALYSGFFSRLGVYAESGTIIMNNLSLRAYRPPLGVLKTIETTTAWYSWRRHPASGVTNETGYWYLANILCLSSSSKVRRVRVFTDYEGSMYLLTNTCSYGSGKEVSANGIYLSTTGETVPSNITGFYTSKSNIYGDINNSSSNRIYDVVVSIATPVDGVAVFDDVSLDIGTGFTVAIDGKYIGGLTMRVCVDYLT